MYTLSQFHSQEQCTSFEGMKNVYKEMWFDSQNEKGDSNIINIVNSITLDKWGGGQESYENEKLKNG